MNYDRINRGALDYCLYHFGDGKHRFRGPRPDLSKPYCAFFGSTETYGKFIARPFTQLLQQRLGMTCANFAAVNAGVDMYLKDPALALVGDRSRLTVVAATGAHNLSNRYYTVHPRRNDRFVGASRILESLYREVDFSEIHFTRHLLATLADANIVKFGLIVEELKMAWTARMKTLLTGIRGPKVLLWMAGHVPGEPGLDHGKEVLSMNPLFVDQAMLDELSPLVDRVVEVIWSDQADADGSGGMVFDADDALAAAMMPGPRAHREAAEMLELKLGDMLNAK